MKNRKHTPGPWTVLFPEEEVPYLRIRGTRLGRRYKVANVLHPKYCQRWEELQKREDEETEANARLIAAAPNLLNALEECIGLAWIEESNSVEFDASVRFGPHYDFSGINSSSREEFLGEYECVVWPSGIFPRKWSAYCTYQGSMWFELFDTKEEAKEQCMRLLDIVLPNHPAIKARAIIANIV